MTTYAGFATGGSRSITQKMFTDPVSTDPTVLNAAVGRSGTVYLDELGRANATGIGLGANYGGQTLVVGARTYDSFGRVVFEADPYSFTVEQFASTYGTTYYYNADGTPSYVIRGYGKQPVPTGGPCSLASDESHEMYPTCFERAFDGNVEITSVKDSASLLLHSPQENVWRQSYTTATGQLLSRSRWQGATSTAPATRLEQATFSHDHLGHLTAMTRYLDAAGATSAVTSSWHYDSLGQVLELDEPNSVPQLNTYSRWGELVMVHRQADSSTAVDVVSSYDALGRLIHKEQRHAGVVDPATVNDYLYDQGVNVAPQVTPTYMTGRLAQAISPTGAVSFSYDALGQINARVFTDEHGAMYVEQHTTHADGSPATLDLRMPDTGYADEQITYGFDSAGRGNSVTYTNGANHQDLFEAPTIDVFGRVRQAQYGATTYAASYADVGRRLINNVNVTSSLGSRAISFQGFDPLGRERSRNEIKNATGSGTTSTWAYDALDRLSTAVKTTGTTTVSNQQYTYYPLGNLLSIANANGAPGAINTTLSYLATDRDRICRIGYGTDSGTACNVTYDEIGSITHQPTRTGTRQLSYFPDGSVASISDGGSQAHFRYDAFGEVQELDLTSSTSSDTRTDRRYGGLIGSRVEKPGTTPTTVYTRTIPGPSGFVATLHGAGGPWVFEFGEARGTRFTTDETGAFVQDVDYSPYGEPTSTGAQPGSTRYTNWQWNGGDALAAFGVSHLGARIYDPVIGRFLSRDPLLIPLTSATTNPYAFANNDPVNSSDPSGLKPSDGPCDELASNCPPPGGWTIWSNGRTDGGSGDFSLVGVDGGFVPKHSTGRNVFPADATGGSGALPIIDLDAYPNLDLTYMPPPSFTLESPASRDARLQDEAKWARRYQVGFLGMVAGLDCTGFGEGEGDCGFGRFMIAGLFNLWPAVATGGASAVATALLEEQGVLLSTGGAAELAAERGATTGVLTNANFAQRTFSQTFSSEGAFAGRTIEGVAGALQSGQMGTADVPVQYIIRDGNTLILNTRSAQALEAARIPRAQWNAVNMTGDAAAETRLTGQLKRNGLSSQGISTANPGR